MRFLFSPVVTLIHRHPNGLQGRLRAADHGSELLSLAANENSGFSVVSSMTLGSSGIGSGYVHTDTLT